jgi:hypothetical protein
MNTTLEERFGHDTKPWTHFKYAVAFSCTYGINE